MNELLILIVVIIFLLICILGVNIATLIGIYKTPNTPKIKEKPSGMELYHTHMKTHKIQPYLDEQPSLFSKGEIVPDDDLEDGYDRYLNDTTPPVPATEYVMEEPEPEKKASSIIISK